MMLSKRVFAGAACLMGLALVPSVSANPEPEFTCLFGYNPTALANVCYDLTDQGESVETGAVGTAPITVCPIGNICAPPVPGPTYDPEGNTTLIQPGGVFVEVLGSGLYLTYDIVVDFLVEQTIHQALTDCEQSQPQPLRNICRAANDNVFG